MCLALSAVTGEILWELKVSEDTCTRHFGKGAIVHLQGGISGGGGGVWESQGGARPTAQAKSRKAAEMDHGEKDHPPAPGYSVAR